MKGRKVEWCADREYRIEGIQGERRPETGECPKPTVIHRCIGDGQQQNKCEGHSPQVDTGDDLAVVADSETDLKERLVEWKEIFDIHELRASLEKT